MNNLGKSKLRRVTMELRRTSPILDDLTTLAESELKAVKRHSRAGNDHFADHASWSADGLILAIEHLRQWDLVPAIDVLATILESSPTDDLQPWDRSEYAEETEPSLPEVCQVGDCNHIEHL